MRKGFIANASSQVIEDICDRYGNGESTRHIGEIYGVCEHTVAKVLRMHEVSVRGRGVVSRLGNPDFFETIDCEEKAYVVGLLLADGYVVYDNRIPRHSPSWGITLKQSDSYMLEAIRELIGSGRKILFQRNEAVLLVSSEKMVNDLKKYGIVPKKHETVRFPFNDVPESYYRHVVRGIFDGDGCISKNHCTFYGNELMVSDVKNVLVSAFNVSDNKVFVKDDGVAMFSFSKRKDVALFYEYMYSDSHICLRRKQERFEKLDFIS